MNISLFYTIQNLQIDEQNLQIGNYENFYMVHSVWILPLF